MKQKILSIFLILCMVLGMLAAGALAVETVGGRSVEQSSAATEITINDGASSNENVPLNNFYNYSVVQYVIPAADLVQLYGKGIVDLTYFYTAQSNTDNDRTLAIYFQEGESFDLESGFVPVDENGLVFSDVASLKDGQLHIDLDEVYLYGGQDLLVTLIDSTGSHKGITYFFGTEGGSSNYHRRDEYSYDAQNLQVSGKHSTFVPKTQIGVINVEAHSITVSETANGTVSAPEEAPQGMRIPLTITPDEGCVLESLTVMQGETVIEVSDDFTFIMPAGDVTISATFKQLERYDIAVEGAANGTVTAPESAYESHTVTLTVTPDAGYALESLTVLQGQTAVEVTWVDKSTCTFIMPAGDVVICATFDVFSEVVLYDGTAERDNVPLDNYFRYSVAQYVIPAADLAVMQGQCLYHLAYFSDYTDAMDRSITVYLMEGDNLDVSDEFIQIAGATQVFSGEVSLVNGKLEINFDEFFFYTGQDLLVTVVDSTGNYKTNADFYGVETDFKSVRAMHKDGGAPYDPMNLTGGSSDTFLPKMEILYTAIPTNNITVEETANGTVTAPQSYYEGGTVTIKVTPDAGYVLESLTVMQGETEIEVGEGYTFIMPGGDVTVIATFKQAECYDITLESGSHGTVTAPENSYEGSTVTLTVAPEEGYALKSLTVMQGETAVEVTRVDATTCTFTMPAGDVTVTTVFVEGEQVIVELFDSYGDGWSGNELSVYIENEDGTETLLQEGLTIEDGESAAAYVFDVPADATLCFRWTKGDYADECSFAITRGDYKVYELGGESLGDTTTGELVARIEPLSWWNITVEVTGNGTVIVPQQSVPGCKVQLTIVPDAGYVLYDLVVMSDGVSIAVDNDYCFVMPAGDVTVIAEFQVPQIYSITVEDNEYVSVEVQSSALAGSEVTLTVRPKLGYHQDGLAAMCKGRDLSLTDHWNGTYSFIMPSGDVTITVDYVEDGHVSNHQEDGYKLIWYSGFETIESMLGLLNWDINDNDEYNWKWWENNGSSVGHEALFMGSDSSSDLTTDNWLILPEMSLQEGRNYLFTLMAQTYDDVEEELFAVYVTTDGGQTLVQLGEKQYAPEELTKFTFDLSDYAGQTIQLMVSHEGTDDVGVLVVDCLCVYQEILTKTYYFEVDGFVPVEADFFGPNGETSYGHPVTHVEGNIYSVCVPDNMNCVMLVDAQDEILLGMGIDLPTDGSNLYIVAENTWSTYDDGTCDHQGETTWIDNGDGTHSEICDLCDTVLTEEPQAHTPGEAVKENETAGSYESVVYCTACGAELSRETIATHTHTLIAVEAKDPTYAIAGNTAYYYCNCGKYFSDAEGVNEIAEGSWIIAALAAGKDNALAIKPTSTGTYATLLLGAELKMSFNVSAKDTAAYDRVFLQITKLGKTTEVEIYSSNSSALQFRYTLAAPEMTVGMTVVVCGEKNGQIYVGETVTFTYRDIVIDKMDSFYNGTNEKNKVYGCALLANLLKYGEEAQKRFNINTDDLATSGLSETYLAMINTATPALDTWTAPAKATYYLGSYSPMLQEQIKIAFTFVVPSYSSLEGYEVRIVQTMSKDGSVKEHIFGADVLKVSSATRIRCDFAIAGAEGRDQLAITLYKDGVAVSETVVTNLSAFAQGKQSDALNPLLYAMVNYCDAAKVFFG